MRLALAAQTGMMFKRTFKVLIICRSINTMSIGRHKQNSIAVYKKIQSIATLWAPFQCADALPMPIDHFHFHSDQAFIIANKCFKVVKHVT